MGGTVCVMEHGRSGTYIYHGAVAITSAVFSLLLKTVIAAWEAASVESVKDYLNVSD